MPINPDYVGGFGRFSFGAPDDSYGADDELGGWQEYARAAYDAMQKKRRPKEVGGGLAVASVQPTPAAPSADYLNSTLAVAQDYLNGNAVTPKDNGPRVQPSGAVGSNVSFGMNPEYLADVQGDPLLKQAQALRTQAATTPSSRIFNADWTNRTRIAPLLERAAMLESQAEQSRRIRHPEWYQVQQSDVPVPGTEGRYVIRNGRQVQSEAWRPDPSKPLDPKYASVDANGVVRYTYLDEHGAPMAREVAVPNAAPGPSPDGGHPAAPLIDPSRQQALEDANRKAALERELKGMETSTQRAVAAGHDATNIEVARLGLPSKQEKERADQLNKDLLRIQNDLALNERERARRTAEKNEALKGLPWKLIPPSKLTDDMKQQQLDYYQTHDMHGIETALAELETERKKLLQHEGNLRAGLYSGGEMPQQPQPGPERPDPASIVQRGAAEIKKAMPPATTKTTTDDPSTYTEDLGRRVDKRTGRVRHAHRKPGTSLIYWTDD